MDSRQAGPQRWTHARPGASVWSAWPPGRRRERRWSARCALAAGVRRCRCGDVCGGRAEPVVVHREPRRVPAFRCVRHSSRGWSRRPRKFRAPACVGAAMGRHDSPFTGRLRGPYPTDGPGPSAQRRRPRHRLQQARRRRSASRPSAGRPRQQGYRREAGGGAGSRAVPAPPPPLLDEPPLGRPAGQLVAVGELELAQHGGHVGLDGLGRDPRPQRDLLVHVAAREVAQDLALAGGELVEVGVGRPARAARAGEGVEDEARRAAGRRPRRPRARGGSRRRAPRARSTSSRSRARPRG